MRRNILVVVLVVGSMAHLGSNAQSVWEKAEDAQDKVKSGDAGYRIGCSTSLANCVWACDELWTDKQREEFNKRCNTENKASAHDPTGRYQDGDDSRKLNANCAQKNDSEREYIVERHEKCLTTYGSRSGSVRPRKGENCIYAACEQFHGCGAADPEGDDQ